MVTEEFGFFVASVMVVLLFAMIAFIGWLQSIGVYINPVGFMIDSVFDFIDGLGKDISTNLS